MVQVYCANCNRLQEDLGKGQTCTHCGSSPVPSYEYRMDNPFYPANCNCAIKSATKVFRKRKIPLPTKPEIAMGRKPKVK